MNIKLIYSRPCHNQSQGKVERYYRALRSKMEYDLRKIGQDGVERAKQLPLYQRILNNKEVIAYKTPFEYTLHEIVTPSEQITRRNPS